MAEQKTVLFAFRGDPLCFIHVLLNSIDMNRRGQEGLIVLEGESVKLVDQMSRDDHFLNALYTKAKSLGLICGACRACATKIEALDAVEKEGIPLVGDMANHPSMGDFIEEGYQVITF